jgi:hypothetical protein
MGRIIFPVDVSREAKTLSLDLNQTEKSYNQSTFKGHPPYST